MLLHVNIQFHIQLHKLTTTMKRCLSTGNVHDSGDAFIAITNKKSKKHKAIRNSLSASQPSTSVVNMEEIIDAVAHINDPIITQDIVLLSDKTALQEIAELRSLVKLLSDQVSFLLSYVGVIETDPSSLHEQHSIPVPVPIPSSKASYSYAVQLPMPPRSLKEAIVTAVYVDQTKKTGQAANVVISGLPVNQLSSDKSSVCKLLANELNLHVNVVKCRRLGKIVSGKTQALLVSLNSVDEADQVMANAKRLRGSSDTTVRDGIYINRHLTAAESRAAYQLRCQRRQSAQQRSTHLAAGASPIAVSGGSTVTVVHGSCSATTTSTLSAAVPPFVPSIDCQANGYLAAGLATAGPPSHLSVDISSKSSVTDRH